MKIGVRGGSLVSRTHATIVASSRGSKYERTIDRGSG
jgi:hypothetical protein